MLEAVQLIKDYTTDSARGAVEFYLDTKSAWKYKGLKEHLRTSLESGETFSSLVSDFYSHMQCLRETEDQFAKELQILSWKVISIRPEMKDEVNDHAFQLHDSYLSVIA